MQLCAATLGCRVPRATLGSFPPLTVFLTPLSHPPPPRTRAPRSLAQLGMRGGPSLHLLRRQPIHGRGPPSAVLPAIQPVHGPVPLRHHRYLRCTVVAAFLQRTGCDQRPAAVCLVALAVPDAFVWLLTLVGALAVAWCAGEMLQMWTALGSLSGLPYKLTLSLLAIYLPGGPFMIMSMFKQRAGASKKRAEQVLPRGDAACLVCVCVCVCSVCVCATVCVLFAHMAPAARASLVISCCWWLLWLVTIESPPPLATSSWADRQGQRRVWHQHWWPLCTRRQRPGVPCDGQGHGGAQHHHTGQEHFRGVAGRCG